MLAVALALAVLGGAVYLLLPGSRTAPRASSAAATGPAPHRHARPASPHRKAAKSPAAAHKSTPAALPRTAPLVPVRAVAFGPGGPGQGDNPQNASLAIDHNPATGWQTSWYATSHFGNLQSGTGLLLDMGHRVTITSAVVTLGSAAGADLQLRVGGPGAVLRDLRPVATAANASGTVRLQLARPRTAVMSSSGSPGCRPTTPAPTGQRSTTSG